jgi:uncharacterized Zn finger protein
MTPIHATLERNGITPPTGNRSKTTCPQCSPTRMKNHETCLKVWASGDFVFWRCFHCGDCSSDLIVGAK